MTKIHYSCSNCGKREVTGAMVGIPHGMYYLGYRAIGSALYCPQCVETWAERNGKDFDEQIANPTTQFARWWNNTLASQIEDKGSIKTYRENAIGDFVEVARDDTTTVTRDVCYDHGEITNYGAELCNKCGAKQPDRYPHCPGCGRRIEREGRRYV